MTAVMGCTRSLSLRGAAAAAPGAAATPRKTLSRLYVDAMAAVMGRKGTLSQSSLGRFCRTPPQLLQGASTVPLRAASAASPVLLEGCYGAQTRAHAAAHRGPGSLSTSTGCLQTAACMTRARLYMCCTEGTDGASTGSASCLRHRSRAVRCYLPQMPFSLAFSVYTQRAVIQNMGTGMEGQGSRPALKHLRGLSEPQNPQNVSVRRFSVCSPRTRKQCKQAQGDQLAARQPTGPVAVDKPTRRHTWRPHPLDTGLSDQLLGAGGLAPWPAQFSRAGLGPHACAGPPS